VCAGKNCYADDFFQFSVYCCHIVFCMKGQLLWEHLIDVDKKYDFPIEMDVGITLLSIRFHFEHCCVVAHSICPRVFCLFAVGVISTVSMT
jgi:hypothetical protein